MAVETRSSRDRSYYSPLLDIIDQNKTGKKKLGSLGLIVSVDGSSAAGKREFGEVLNNEPATTAIDGDMFLKPRTERPLPQTTKELYEVAPHSISVRDWHDLGKLISSLDGIRHSLTRGTERHSLQGLYKHDERGETDKSLDLDLNVKTLVLTGRYSLDPEVQEAINQYNIPNLRIIFDSSPSQRLERVLKRAKEWRSRPVEQQRAIQTQIAEPDWRTYLPTIFGATDIYVATKKDKLTTSKPADMIDRSHVWGRYADLYVDPDEIYRMIEIGPEGKTSIHKHHNLEETYHVANGPLKVQRGKDLDALEMHVLSKGDTITIPHGHWHSAGSFNGSTPLYYETVLPKVDKINPNDIEKSTSAKPMSGQLSVLHL